MGLAPTDTWETGALIRDTYQLTLPATTPPGTYQLLVGLYDEKGRSPLTLADGRQTDHVELLVVVSRP
jgi:hypothetical protein